MKRITYEFITGIISTSILWISLVLIENAFKTYRIISGESVLIFLIILAFPCFCLLGYIMVDKLFFQITEFSFFKIIVSFVCSSLVSALGIVFVQDLLQKSEFVKISLILFVIVGVSLLMHNIINLK